MLGLGLRVYDFKFWHLGFRIPNFRFYLLGFTTKNYIFRQNAVKTSRCSLAAASRNSSGQGGRPRSLRTPRGSLAWALQEGENLGPTPCPLQNRRTPTYDKTKLKKKRFGEKQSGPKFEKNERRPKRIFKEFVFKDVISIKYVCLKNVCVPPNEDRVMIPVRLAQRSTCFRIASQALSNNALLALYLQKCLNVKMSKSPKYKWNRWRKCERNAVQTSTTRFKMRLTWLVSLFSEFCFRGTRKPSCCLARPALRQSIPA